METYIQLFMIATVLCLFGLIAAGINRRWWWVLGFTGGVIVSVAASLIHM